MSLFDWIYFIVVDGAILYALFQLYFLIVADADTVTFRSQEKKEYYQEKVIWVTGASSGIGKAFVLHVAKLNVGAKFILTARTKSALEELKKELKEKFNTESFVVVCDLSKLDSIENTVKQAIECFGYIDILMNNAGFTQRSTCHETKFQVDQEMLTVNLFACIALGKFLLPHFMKRKTGHFVNISSIAGLFAVPVRTAYCASKFGLKAYYQSLRLEQEYLQTNVKVTNVYPGSTQTDVSKNARLGDGSVQGFTDQSIASGMPLDRFTLLMSKAISNQIEESWICLKAQKIAIYSVQYMPWLHRKLMKGATKKLIESSTTKHQ